jgi:hypothetical protein
MKPVDVGYQYRGCQHEQEEVADQEVRAPEGQLNDLDDEFARWLRKHVRAEATTVPLARPPCPIGLIMFKFTRKKHRD